MNAAPREPYASPASPLPDILSPAFTAGAHGAHRIMRERAPGVGQLLDAMPDLRLAEGFTPVERGVFTRGPESLPVRFTPVV